MNRWNSRKQKLIGWMQRQVYSFSFLDNTGAHQESATILPVKGSYLAGFELLLSFAS